MKFKPNKKFLLLGLLVLALLTLGCSEVTIEDEHGNKYVGEVKDGEPHGQGKLTFADGFRYEGDFKESEFHGQGILYYEDGTKTYEGDWMISC